MRKLYAYYFYFVFVLTFLLLYPIFFYLLSNDKRHPRANKLRRFWAKLIFVLMGYRWEVEYEQQLDPDQTYIFCPNHSSNLDIPLFPISYDGHFKFMAKKEWAEIPIFGIFFRTVDIPVDRFNKIGAYKAFVQAGEELEKGVNLVIFAEGKMFADGPQTRPFKSGPFRLAIEKNVPIVPITFRDNWRLYPTYGTRGASPGKLRALVHKPVYPEDIGLQNEAEFRRHVQSIIDDQLKSDYPEYHIQIKNA